MDNNEYIITGVKISDQMQKANKILEYTVIPRENLFQKRKKQL